jgi:UPF0716 protein FxsA
MGSEEDDHSVPSSFLPHIRFRGVFIHPNSDLSAKSVSYNKSSTAPRCPQTENDLAKASYVFLRFLLLLATIPLLELWLLIELTKRTSLWWTIALVLFTGMLGMSLVRWQGMKALKQIQEQLASGQSPSQAIISGVLVLVAGAFLLTPGIITDTAGFLLLIPQLRSAIARYAQKRLVNSAVNGIKGSVWVSSFSTDFPGANPVNPVDVSERPSVQVIDPNQPMLKQ